MQVTETKNEGLKREFNVKIDAKSVDEQMETQLRATGERVKIAGFRPGHVPITVLKQRFGKSVIGEVIERAVNQAAAKVLRDKNLRAAMHPKIEITSYDEGSDLDFRMEVELMPELPEIDFSKITLEKLVSVVDEKEIDEAVTRLADRNKNFVKAEKGTKAAKGDQLLIDFVGRVDGKEFEGGAAKGFGLELGSGSFIDTFEKQLEGTQEGDKVTVKVTFPEHYHKDTLAGQPAEFDVTVHEVRKGAKSEATDELAKKMGFADLAAMRKAVQEQFDADYDMASRARMKKQLFDALENDYQFEVPQGMLDGEFAAIWEKLQQAKQDGDETFADKSDEELKAEYTRIAKRRVKLGILLSEIASKNKIQVNQDELSRAVMQQAGQYPGQERKVFEFYQKNPQHLEELRGPILEEKAVDFILSKAKITERKVSPDELMREDDEAAESEENTKKKTARKKKAANE